MILFVDNNSGILFIKRLSGAVKKYIAGTIATATSLAGALIGYGVVSVTVQTYSDVSGYMQGLGRMAVHVFTRTYVSGYLNLPVWITELFDKVSGITKIFKRNSNIDGD